MRKRWITSLALSLGLLATGVRAGEDDARVPPRASTASSSRVVWRGSLSSAPAAPLDTQDKPVTGSTSAPSSPAVQLGRPVATLSRPIPVGIEITDLGLQPVSFKAAETNSVSEVRGQSSDRLIPRAMPPGPANPDSPVRSFVWEPVPTPLPVAPGTTPEAMPAPGPSIPGILTPGQAGSPQGVVVTDPLLLTPTIPSVESPGGLEGTCCGADSCCCDGGCDACCGCGCYPGHRFYVSGEYLLWWTKGSPLPPLLTTSSGPPPSPAFPSGALGLPGTQVLLGNQDVANTARSGARVMAGFWLDDERLLGFELGGFFLQPLRNRFFYSSDGSVQLTRPDFNLQTGQPGVELVGGTAVDLFGITHVLTGTFTAVHKSFVWGAEANARSCLLCNSDFFLDGLVGVRTLGLYESLDMVETPTEISPGSISNTIQDNFKTRNQFYGGQIGTIFEIRRGPWSVNATTKLGLGITQQRVTISGSQLIMVPGMPSQTVPFGFLANQGIVGVHSRNVFSVVPEVGVNLGYQLTQRLRLFVGYNVLYWTKVVRPGQQINLAVNPTLFQGLPLVGAVPPAFVFHDSNFWAQGVTVGLEYRF